MEFSDLAASEHPVQAGIDSPPADEHVFSRTYEQLRAIAHRQLRREAPGHTLCTTALVHEAYLALADRQFTDSKDRADFLALASRAMRNVLVDYARSRNTLKRGGPAIRVPLRDDLLTGEEGGTTDVDLLTLNQALTELARRDARLSRIVECRFFGGMTVDETAAALGVAKRTIERDWMRAKAYLCLFLAE